MSAVVPQGRAAPTLDVPSLAALIGTAPFHFAYETDIQEGIAKILDKRGIAHQREVVLGPADRIDFLVGSLGIEVKMRASLTEVTRQLHRYALRDQIDHLMLVTTSLKHRICMPPSMNDKPLTVVVLMGAML